MRYRWIRPAVPELFRALQADTRTDRLSRDSRRVANAPRNEVFIESEINFILFFQCSALLQYDFEAYVK
jgi:hypothetical protein